MESSDTGDDEYLGRSGDQVGVKGQLSSLLKSPPPVDKPTTLQPRGGSFLSPQPWSGGWVRGMNTFGGILCKYHPCYMWPSSLGGWVYM